jgi:probable HAF family extracellular repeat protein
MRNHLLKSMLLLLLASPLAALADPAYTIQFLPQGLSPYELNNQGQVVGEFGGSAAIWSESGLVTLSGQFPYSRGFGINNHGDITGSAGNAFTYVSGTVHDLGTSMPAWVAGSEGRGINDRGVVVGTAWNEIGEHITPFIYNNGQVEMLGTLYGTYGSAMAVNQRGDVVGDAGWEVVGMHAFLFSDGAMRDLGTFGGERSWARDINDAGQVVGSAETIDAFAHPFLFQDGTMTDLGTLGGTDAWANAINDAGMIVGNSFVLTSGGSTSHAFLYLNGQMTDMNQLLAGADGWVVDHALAINDGGQILGTACRMGTCTGVLLTPVSPVPEPSSAMMLLGGLAAALGTNRWRRRGQGLRVSFLSRPGR